ncbi:uncharacterized protein LOC127729728 [Mytilus californianus]|uniref:uncharacterized protein LOC127729728 n=1 Tax=Mytilus californianus TaxID=6549 RepID=UPI002245155D|nr:uncharacterized protein LOC127729728 [Mytilus californianus]
MKMFSSTKEIDVERLRSPFESNTEWKIRKKFLVEHVNKFDEDRLICLSLCYVNVRQMGCSYPTEVMKQLNELAKDLGEDDISDVTNLPSRIKGIETVKFVKSSDKISQDSSSLSGPSPPKKIVPMFGMNFVKSSSEFKSTDVAMHEEQSQQKSDQSLVHVCDMKPFPTQRAKGSGLGYGTPKYSITGIKDIDIRFRTLANAITDLKKKFGSSKNSIEILQMAVDKTKMSLDTKFRDIVGSQYAHTFVCSLTVDFVEISEGKATNKKTAKHTAFDLAVEKLHSTDICVDQSIPDRPVLKQYSVQRQSFNSECTTKQTANNDYLDKQRSAYNLPCSFVSHNTQPDSFEASKSFAYDSSNYDDSASYNSEMYESNFKAVSKGNRQLANSLNGDITKFIIFENVSIDNTSNPLSILRQSCDINKALLEFHYELDAKGVNMHCTVDIEGETIAEASEEGKVHVKTLAALKAINELRKICWTIKIKQSIDCQSDDSISRDSVMGEIQKQMETISDDNIGSKLLRKMGWSGGGVGAVGNIGREEPVAVSLQQIINREGLGLNSGDGMKDFRNKVRKVVEDYAKSDAQEDLSFTSDYTKEERAYIHTISQRLGLKSQSRGKGDNRYLTLSRKRTTNQLFDHLINEGGSTHKYELVPPENSEY